MDDNSEEIWYQQQKENDEIGNWSCFTDIANGSDPEFVQDFLDGNWVQAVDERSDEPVIIPTNRSVGQKNVSYKAGDTVTITVTGSAQFVTDVKNVITTYAQPRVNLKFQFVDSGGAITIDNNYTGGGVTRCLGCKTPSISISSGSKGLVLHEFGHALGMQHEMKNPNLKVTWIESVLVQQYGSQQFVTSQITSKVNPSSVNALAFDKNSIMIYNLPAKTNQEGIAMTPSSDYTDLDKQWLIMTYGPPPGTTGTVTVPPPISPVPPPSTTTIVKRTNAPTTKPVVKSNITKAVAKAPLTTKKTQLKAPSQSQLDLLPPIIGTGTSTIGGTTAQIIITSPSWLDNIILFVLSFFS